MLDTWNNNNNKNKGKIVRTIPKHQLILKKKRRSIDKLKRRISSENKLTKMKNQKTVPNNKMI